MRRRKNRKFWQPVVSGLVVIYLATMLLSTYLVKERFAEEYRQAFKEESISLHEAVSECILQTWRQTALKGAFQTGEEKEAWAEACQTLLGEYFQGIDHRKMQISAAIYDREKRLLARSQNTPCMFGLSQDNTGDAAVENRHRWNQSEYLQEFPEEEEFFWEEGLEEPSMEVVADGLKFRGRYSLKIGDVAEPLAYVEIRMECSPWAAALEYMKYLYLWGAVLVLVCMWKILHVFREVYNRKAALEETRRDFTNAMAHELKTPLGVIRNFAENLLEHNQEEKREYYLTQIIGQTEEMDHLVVGMIEVSKLDSEDLVLKKENVSFSELIREQMERFTPMIQEKNIQVEFLGDGDFQVEGDREYLARAVWNLLSNAVSYNIPDGRIRVKTEKGSCSIENTGRPMEEEQLRHAFDLFYTGNESRGGKEKHLGMGLFLARKILGLHGLTLTVENGGDGVRAVIRG